MLLEGWMVVVLIQEMSDSTFYNLLVVTPEAKHELLAGFLVVVAQGYL